MFRHGLRVSELCAIKLSDINVNTKEFHVNRLKGCDSGPHELYNGEPAAVKTWLVERAKMKVPADCDTLFVSERRKPLSRITVWHMIGLVAKAAGLDLSPVLHVPQDGPGGLPRGDLHCTTRQDHGLEKALDNTLILLAEGALDQSDDRVERCRHRLQRQDQRDQRRAGHHRVFEQLQSDVGRGQTRGGDAGPDHGGDQERGADELGQHPAG